MTGLAYAGQHSDSVFGTGTLDVGDLRPRAASRGSWSACAAPASPFDGLYYVKSVTTTSSAGRYKQSFSLARNGLISTLPTVPV